LMINQKQLIQGSPIDCILRASLILFQMWNNLKYDDLLFTVWDKGSGKKSLTKSSRAREV
jgi:hypothetical protein